MDQDRVARRGDALLSFFPPPIELFIKLLSAMVFGLPFSRVLQDEKAKSSSM